MSKIYLIIAFFYTLISCGEKKINSKVESIESVTKDKTTNVETVNYSVKTIQSEKESWGYQILKNNKAIINQPNIPAIQGNKGFTNEKMAKKTGDFVLQKIQRGEFPPIVTVEELDSLGIN
jgi:hypothetical protein